ncbi:MAG: protease complex subunit PrcB family protein [Spirochaetales bacterium]|nr:protease complex subunit PrcB family protein [Spirochaetales bacterium]
MKASIIITLAALALALSCAGKPEPVAATPEPEAVSAVTGATEYAGGEGSAASASAVEVAVPLEARILVRGQNARAEEPSVSVVRNAAAFAGLWASVAAPGAAKPELDFAAEAVVAAFMGRKNTGGFSIELVAAESLADGSVLVRLRKLAPKPGMMVTQALTSPFLALAVPAAPDADVVVEFVE